MVRYALEVKGIVQGVGFRPFVFRLAKELSLSGFVKNTSKGVSIEIEGPEADCKKFIAALRQPPPLARIERLDAEKIPPTGAKDFVIQTSSAGARNTFISPDIGICADCFKDITTKENRRYRYAFTNCTNCGPRFSIVKDIPYDRANTTMAEFALCADCKREYEDPYDRRFHAQPNACPVCGPQLFFYENGREISGDPIRLFSEAVSSGKTVAVKGVGGYHLACDALNEEAVGRLRKRKLRYDKPFAVMMRDIETVKRYCEVSGEEEPLLASPEKPIVLLKKKPDCPIARSVTMRNNRLGVMLPYAPLHCLLMQNHEALVMTSGNLSDHPMIFDDSEALQKLPAVADCILTHNRRIFRRVDDSVSIVINGKVHLIRRARGYVPEPARLDGNQSVILALGAQQKNTFCLCKGENAFLSGHIGDLDEADTAECLEREIESFVKIFDADPQVIACDLHPDYVSTRIASRYEGKLPIFHIQHHHAHMASVLAEHGLTDNAIGFTFDGTGLGLDGRVWGGEVLYGNRADFARCGHLLYFPLLGGEGAVREPWRCALAVTDIACGRGAAFSLFPEYLEEAKILLAAGDKNINAPLTSSMGRLFDAVSALCGIRKTTTYEGQAAVELQQVMDESAAGAYRFEMIEEHGRMIFDWRPLIRAVVADVQAGIPAGTVSLKFHRAVAELIVSAANRLRAEKGCDTVVLTGGVFQNDFLLEKSMKKLEESGFAVYTNQLVPVNDGGLSFGQAAVASARIRK